MLVDLAVIGYFVTLGLWFEFYEGHGLLPSCSPNIETVYAMTIHKNQGSEFESVYLCLNMVCFSFHQEILLNSVYSSIGVLNLIKSYVFFRLALFLPPEGRQMKHTILLLWTIPIIRQHIY